jgi:xanthine dehydrogenase YagT iron-sulfur-binding subunit
METEMPKEATGVSRRDFVGATLAGSAASMLPTATSAVAAPPKNGAPVVVSCKLVINGEEQTLEVDSRVTLLDLLRERLHLTGTKKGCDHGQCGACTVLVNGRRINSCLSLAVMHDGDHITTIEGLAQDGNLHPMQAAFIEFDGFQCGYCTPGQICSAVAMLDEVKAGAPSYVTAKLAEVGAVSLTDDEIRERMSGNICRCGAYVGIVDAIKSVAHGRNA